MPHSSGGGSHGGGSHGGSHHSGGHRSSSGYSGPRYRTSTRPFMGAHRYVYYHNHRPVYRYANYDISQTKVVARPWMIIFYIPFIIAVFAVLGGAIHAPKKLSQNYDAGVYINDKADIMSSSDEDKLEKALDNFFESTGISPAVVTVDTSEWKPYYNNLERFAYDEYVKLFDDEKHWLIVYSVTVNSDSDFKDWSFEGMQGDDTDPIITEKIANSFNDELYKELVREDEYTPAQAIANTFDMITPACMKSSINFGQIMMGIIIAAFIVFHAWFMMGINPKAKKLSQARIIPDNAQETTCMYCQGIYIVGISSSCPHCGAPASVKTNISMDSSVNQLGNMNMNQYGNVNNNPYGNSNSNMRF